MANHQRLECFADDSNMKHGRPFDVRSLGCILLDLVVMWRRGRTKARLPYFRSLKSKDIRHARKPGSKLKPDFFLHGGTDSTKACIINLREGADVDENFKDLVELVIGMLFESSRKQFVWEIDMELHKMGDRWAIKQPKVFLREVVQQFYVSSVDLFSEHQILNRKKQLEILGQDLLARISEPEKQLAAERHENKSYCWIAVGSSHMPDFHHSSPLLLNNTNRPNSCSLSPSLGPLVPHSMSAFDVKQISRSHRHVREIYESLGRTAETIAYDCGWQIGEERFLEGKPRATLKLVDHLGHGAAGIVDAVRIDLGVETFTDLFVRKRIRISRSKKSRALELEAVRKEIDNLRRAEHVHIVRVLGSYRDESPKGSFACILTSPVGKDLQIFFDSYKNTEQEDAEQGCLNRLWIKKWFGCLASALACMHRSQVQHKDIKPRNIVHVNEHIYFTDFSSSRNYESGHTSTWSLAQDTQRYRAPEISSRERHGNESDIFALGLVFVEMLTVLVGSSIDDLHEYMQCRNGFADTPSQREYWRVVNYFGNWFSSGEGLKMYNACIKPMLANERKSRPTAAQVEALIKENQPWRKTLACPCKDVVDDFTAAQVEDDIQDGWWSIL